MIDTIQKQKTLEKIFQTALGKTNQGDPYGGFGVRTGFNEDLVRDSLEKIMKNDPMKALELARYGYLRSIESGEKVAMPIISKACSLLLNKSPEQAGYTYGYILRESLASMKAKGALEQVRSRARELYVQNEPEMAYETAQALSGYRFSYYGFFSKHFKGYWGKWWSDKDEAKLILEKLSSSNLGDTSIRAHDSLTKLENERAKEN